MTPTKEEVMVGKDTSNTWRTPHREICVIRKIKGDNTLYVTQIIVMNLMLLSNVMIFLQQ